MAGLHIDAGSVARQLWSTACSAPVRFGLFALFVVGTLAYGGALAWYTLERFDLFNMVRDGYFDDAFYYFQIAYHMAEGRFSTFDGFTRTNGYHPLWLFLITPFYWVFDKVEALFAIKAFEIMLIAAGMALVAAAARAARLPWILLFAALPPLYAEPGMRLGMEAGLVLFMLGLLMLAMCLFARDPARWRWLLATTAFALPWVRLECAAVAVAATAAVGVLEWSGRLPGTRAVRKPGELKAAVPLAGAFAGMLVYFAYNGIVFGGVAPVSAVWKRMWSQRHWNREGGYSLFDNFRDLIDGDLTISTWNVFDDELWMAFEVGVYALLVWLLLRRSGKGEAVLPSMLAFMLGVFALGVGHLAKFAQSVLTMHPHWAYHNWYFVPAFLMEALVVPARCCVAICAVQLFVASGRVQAVLRSSIVACGLIALMAKTDFGAPFRFVDERAHQPETTVHSWRVPDYLGTLAMNHLLPENSVVGSWDSGIVGYFSRFTVVNLDGLANSYDYFRAGRTGALEVAQRQLGARFTHFANIVRLLSDIHPFQHRYVRPGTPARSLLSALMYPAQHWREDIFHLQIAAAEPAEGEEGRVADQAASFWERIRPHRRTGDIALVLHGRVALAFRPDCAAEEVAEWSWDAVESRYASPWARTAIGVCVTAIVLPSALPPVQVETMTVDGWLAEHHATASAKFHADFDVALVENRVFFMKGECAPGDIDPVFFLHVVPTDTDDLPPPRQQHGYDNLDFKFSNQIHWLNGRGGWCVAEVQLPNYRMAAIRAGQYVVEGEALRRIWEGEMHLERQSGA